MIVIRELSFAGQPLQLLLQDPQGLHRGLIRLDIIDADLEVIEAGIVESADALGREQVGVADQCREDAVGADPGDDRI